MKLGNYVANWNRLDSIILFCENKLCKLKAAACESEEPDVELMIQAETDYLRTENENLKKREIPAYLIEEGDRHFCPKCRTEIIDIVKYCPNCGRRVMRACKSAHS